MGAGDAVRRVARDARDFVDKWPRQGADVAADIMRAELARDGGGRFSNAPHMTARVDTKPGSGSATVVGVGGGWTWLQDGTRTHTVTAGRGRLLRTPYGPRRKVTVTGMAAKNTWTRGAARAIPEIVHDAEAAFGKVVR